VKELPGLPQYNNSTKVPNKAFCRLTEKEELGYNYEIKSQSFFNKLNISFSANPLNKFLWKRVRGKGTDIQTSTLDIECKFVRKKVYPAHLKNNVYPRFKNDNKKKIVLTNDKSLWSKTAKEELSKNRISLWNSDNIKEYYSKPSFTSIYNFIKYNMERTTNLYKFIISKVSILFNKTETDKIESLNRYFPDKNRDITVKKEVLPELNCYNCKNKDICNLLSQVQDLWNKKPQIYLKQFNIDSSFKVDSIDLVKFKNRKKEWLKELGEAQNLQYKCLTKRSFLHLNMNYKLFD
jgi:hypothetical protein